MSEIGVDKSRLVSLGRRWLVAFGVVLLRNASLMILDRSLEVWSNIGHHPQNCRDGRDAEVRRTAVEGKGEGIDIVGNLFAGILVSCRFIELKLLFR